MKETNEKSISLDNITTQNMDIASEELVFNSFISLP